MAINPISTGSYPPSLGTLVEALKADRRRTPRLNPSSGGQAAGRGAVATGRSLPSGLAGNIPQPGFVGGPQGIVRTAVGGGGQLALPPGPPLPPPPPPPPTYQPYNPVMGLPQQPLELGPGPIASQANSSAPIYSNPPGAGVNTANIGMQSRFGVNNLAGSGEPIAMGGMNGGMGTGPITPTPTPSSPGSPLFNTFGNMAGPTTPVGPTTFANAAEAMATREAGGFLGAPGANANASMYGANRQMGLGKLQSFLPEAKLQTQLNTQFAKQFPQAAGQYTDDMIAQAAKGIKPTAMVGPAIGAAGMAYTGHTFAPTVANLIADESEKDTAKGLMADVAGGATRGAGVGAGLGLLGGPFAGFTVPGAALAGLVGGGVAGAITHAMGNSEIEGDEAAPDNRSVGEKLNAMLDQSGFQSGTPERMRMAETMNALINADKTPAGQEAAFKAGQQMIMEGIGERQQKQIALEQQLAYQSLAQQVMGPMLDKQQASTDMYRSAMESVMPSLPANFQPIARFAMESNSEAGSKTAQAYLTQAMTAPQLQEMLNAQELQQKIDSRMQSQEITELLKQQQSQGAAGIPSQLAGQALGG